MRNKKKKSNLFSFTLSKRLKIVPRSKSAEISSNTAVGFKFFHDMLPFGNDEINACKSALEIFKVKKNLA